MATQGQNTQQRKGGSKAEANKPTRQSGPAARSGSAPQQAAQPSGAREQDENYAIVSVLYHSLQGAETAGKYIEDARRAGDSELIEFFEESRRLDNERAAQASRLLASRLAVDEEEDEDEDDEDDEEEDEDE